MLFPLSVYLSFCFQCPLRELTTTLATEDYSALPRCSTSTEVQKYLFHPLHSTREAVCALVCLKYLPFHFQLYAKFTCWHFHNDWRLQHVGELHSNARNQLFASLPCSLFDLFFICLWCVRSLSGASPVQPMLPAKRKRKKRGNGWSRKPKKTNTQGYPALSCPLQMSCSKCVSLTLNLNKFKVPHLVLLLPICLFLFLNSLNFQISKSLLHICTL